MFAGPVIGVFAGGRETYGSRPETYDENRVMVALCREPDAAGAQSAAHRNRRRGLPDSSCALPDTTGSTLSAETSYKGTKMAGVECIATYRPAEF